MGIGGMACPKPPKGSYLLERRKRKADKAAALDEAYAAVNARDGSICWATGWYTSAGAANTDQRREHHHLSGRRVKPEWRHDPDRIITLCASAHQLVTGGYLVVEGDDARKPIRFHWALPRGMKPPFLLKSRRKSQHKVEAA